MMRNEDGDSALRVGLLAADLSNRHGWAQYSLNLSEALRRAGVRLTVVTTQDSPHVEGLPVHKLLPPHLTMGRTTLLQQSLLAPRIRPLLRDCDVIHAAIEPFAPLAAWVVGERPLFITGHGTYVRSWTERSRIVTTPYRRAFLRSTLVCVSQYTAQVARETLPSIRTVVVNNGVDVERYQRPVEPMEKHGPTVLSVGAVKARKGALELVRAMAAVRREIPDVQCLIIGSVDAEPGYVEQVRALIHELDLGGCVHLPGHVPEAVLLGWYHTADVFVLPSMHDGNKFEGYGLVYLEASAAGLPVIGTTECGAEDAIDDGITGLLVPRQGAAEHLPGAILRVLRDPALAARMGAAGREKAAGQTWDHVAAQMIALYNKGR